MKRDFTVGDIAKIINVARSTVINWIKAGKLNAFTLPGGNNRVSRENLVAFMKEYDIPLDYLEENASKRVLVVDDDEDVLNVLKQALEQDGNFMVRTASTGFQTGVITREYRPNLIVLDIALEDIDGRDVCRTVKNEEELKQVKILGISGAISPEEEKALMDKGFDGYLRKPFEPEELISKAKNLLNIL